MLITLFLYMFLSYSICLFIIYGNMPIIHIPIIGFAIFKATMNYRVCSVAYAECKFRKVKREDSIVNNLLDPIVDLRYTDHIYPLFIIGYFLIYLSIINYLKYYIR